jgi:predicted nucleic acid-binding protein
MRQAEMERALVDTNIVIYAHDPTDSAKHETARQLLQNLSDAGRLTYSAQVFNEFCSRMMRPGRPPALTPEQVRDIVRDLRTTGEVFPITDTTTTFALDAVIAYSMSFWDALLWAAAREYGVTLIYTEDLPGMPEIEGVRYVNPFDNEDINA